MEHFKVFPTILTWWKGHDNMATPFSLGQGPDKNQSKGIAKRLQFLVYRR